MCCIHHPRGRLFDRRGHNRTLGWRSELDSGRIGNRWVGARWRWPKTTGRHIFAIHAPTVDRALDVSGVALAVLLYALRLAALASQLVRYRPRVGNVHATHRACRIHHTTHHRGSNLTVVLLEFCVKGGRISRQNRPNRVLPSTFVLRSVLASEASTVSTAIDLDGKALTI